MTKSYTRNGQYTNDDVRIDGKIVIVTGANIGLGLATAKDLAKRGGKIYLACRNEERGTEAVKTVIEFSKNENVKFLSLDLASLESVREFSKKFHELEDRLDILVNNAGLLAPDSKTIEGFEMHMGVNHLGHFLLTNLLLDLLKASDQGRIVIVASEIHQQFGSINKEDLIGEKTKFPGSFKAYGNSKCANILFMREISKRLKDTKVTCNACCPGPVSTDVGKDLGSIFKSFLRFFMRFTWFYKSPEEGAQTQIMLAVEPELQDTTGKYFVKCLQKQPSANARDDETAQWLWNESEKLTHKQ